MSDTLSWIKKPELVIGIAGPIGVDMDAIGQSLGQALSNVGYRPCLIRLTEEMLVVPTEVPPRDTDFYAEAESKMLYGNAVRRAMKDPAALARIGVMAIRSRRGGVSGNPNVAADGTAYILRQLKRPEEVDFLRRLYGRQFVLVSAYGAYDRRRLVLQETLRQSMDTVAEAGELAAGAERLIATDAKESDKEYGQQLRDTFHHGDVFIDGLSRPEMDNKLTRFVQGLFGRTDIGPSKDEFGMYTATAAAFRSTDLSRQVGAAIFTPDGALIAQGCNEVPRAFGGAYWDTESPDFRDVRLGIDPNAREIRVVLRDLFEKLSKADMLSDTAKAMGQPADIVRELASKTGVLADASIMDLTEYGRVVHAEMHAITEAARLGRATQGGILYCTTFPCHNCTKHILAAGIRRVIYIEPYPKSRADTLYANEISIENDSPDKVEFKPFLGISPVRYRDIFQKKSRKGPDGRAKTWYRDEARPMIDIMYPTYLALERYALRPLLEKDTKGSAE